MTDDNDSQSALAPTEGTAADQDDDASVDRGGVRWHRSLWVGLALLIGVLAAINFPYEQSPLSNLGLKPSDDHDFGMSREIFGTVTEAGWPLRYYVHHQFVDGSAHSRWLLTAVLINLTLAVVSVVAVFWYLRRQGRPVSMATSAGKPRRIALSLSDLLVLIGLIAIPMGYWQRQTHLQRMEEQVERQIASSVTVTREVLAPEALRRHLPQFLADAWSRITRVDVHQPTSENIELVCKLPFLRSVRIGGGDYDTTPLSRLPSMRYLVDLRVAGRSIDAPTVQAIAACPIVSQLNIARTNCSDASLAEFAKMPRLKHLMAFGSDIDDGAWQESAIKDQLESLYIARPKTGEGGSFAVRGWPKLTTLAIQSRDQFVNRNVFEIEAAEMPQLEELEIDVFQLVDLTLNDLPKLGDITRGRRNLYRRVADGERAPSFIWGRNLRLTKIPLLKLFQFNCDGFESIQIDQCDGLEKLMGTSMSQFGSEDFTFDYQLDKTSRQNLVDAFGKLSGPFLLGMYGHRLDDLDLSKLTTNTEVRALDFNSSIVSQANIDALAPMKDLETFGFYKAQIDSKIIGRVNKLFPKLKFLAVHEDTTAIRLEDKPELLQVNFAEYEHSPVSALRLINVPKMTSPLIVNDFGRYCVVKGAPSMTGLGIQSPIKSTEISDVGGLKWFAGGGATLSDAVVVEVLKAMELEELTFAYPVAGSESFAGLFDLKKLRKLIIPGVRVNDEQFASWEMPASLIELNLDDCGLSDETIARILARGNWVRLSVKGNQISSDSLRQLGQSPALGHLALGKIEIDAETVKAMPDLPMLDSLDLSGATIAKGSLMEINKKFYGLSELHLIGATFDHQEMLSLMQTNPVLKYELTPNDGSVEIITQLTASDRLIRPGFEWFGLTPQVLGYDAAGRPVYDKKVETRKEFEPPALDIARYRQVSRRARLNPMPAAKNSDAQTNADPDGQMPADNAASVVGRAFGLLLGGEPVKAGERTVESDSDTETSAEKANAQNANAQNSSDETASDETASAEKASDEKASDGESAVGPARRDDATRIDDTPDVENQ
ncbi:MAG: hypothetical protein HKN47_25505 [Pirellulaceae bacterium]|nr:hypothetical protein [Pirellulaceae bacterium]